MTTVELPPISPQTYPDGRLHPQERALLSTADIIVVGGSAGGGKTWTAAYFAGRWNHVPEYRALVTRRESPQLTGGGGIWDQAKAMYVNMGVGAKCTQDPMNAVWDTDARVEFRHMEQESDVENHDGMQYGAVVIDEGQMYTGYMIWYLWGRCRTTANLHGVAVKPQMMITCNPNPDCYLRTLIDRWIGPNGLPVPEMDGVILWCLNLNDQLTWFETETEAMAYVRELQSAHPGDVVYEHMRPTSVTFIRSQLSDNRKLLDYDPTYGARLGMLDVVNRARKLGGNWDAKAYAGELFNRSWFGIVDGPPDPSQVYMLVRGWDTAASLPTPANPNPDWSRGCLWCLTKDMKLWLLDIVSIRDAPGAVDELMRTTATADGPRVIQALWQDPASAGVYQIEHFKRVFPTNTDIRIEVERKDKLAYASAWSARIDPRMRLNQTQAYILRGPWNQGFFSEIEAFGVEALKNKNIKKDQVDACSRAWLEMEKVTTGFMGQFGAAMDRVML